MPRRVLVSESDSGKVTGILKLISKNIRQSNVLETNTMSFVTRVGSIIRRGPNSVRILASRNLSTNSDRKEPTTNAVQFVPKDITEELARKVENNDRSLREKYDTLLSDSDNCSSAGIDKYTALRKRLLYRSKQRGWCVVAHTFSVLSIHLSTRIRLVQARSGLIARNVGR